MTWNQLPPPPWVIIGCLPQGSNISSHSMHVAADSAMKHMQTGSEVNCDVCVFKCTDSRRARWAGADLFMEINRFVFKSSILLCASHLEPRSALGFCLLEGTLAVLHLQCQLALRRCLVMQYQNPPIDDSLGEQKTAKLREE